MPRAPPTARLRDSEDVGAAATDSPESSRRASVPCAHALEREVHRHRRLPRAGRARREGSSCRPRPRRRASRRARRRPSSSRRDVACTSSGIRGEMRRGRAACPSLGDAEGVLSLAIRRAAQLEHAQVALVARAECLASELDDRVARRELGDSAACRRCVYSPSSRSSRRTPEQPGQIWTTMRRVSGARAREIVNGAERVDDDDLGARRA